MPDDSEPAEAIDSTSAAVERDAAGGGWLTPQQEAVLGAFVFAGLVAIAAWYVIKGGLSGHLVDIDQAGPLEAQYAVDINTAEWPEFMPLPDVGETLARRIVEYRASNGPYQSIDGLLEVPGIGEKKLASMRPFLFPVGPDDDANDDDAQHKGVAP